MYMKLDSEVFWMGSQERKASPKGRRVPPKGEMLPSHGGFPGEPGKSLAPKLHQTFSYKRKYKYNYHDFKLYLSIAKTSGRPEGCAVWEPDMRNI